jgi:hypothetical protein
MLYNGTLKCRYLKQLSVLFVSILLKTLNNYLLIAIPATDSRNVVEVLVYDGNFHFTVFEIEHSFTEDEGGWRNV